MSEPAGSAKSASWAKSAHSAHSAHSAYSAYSVGVEEEFHVVDRGTGELRAAGAAVVGGAQAAADGEVEAELQRSQVETGTPPVRHLADVRSELIRLRGEVGAAAAEVGCALAASGTFPSACRPAQVFTDSPRYQAIGDRFGVVARQQTVCGCHVHVGVEDQELAIAVLNRVRPWLPVLLAISANSPFWAGEDTDYASYRSQVWSRWPTAGTPGVFESRAEYDALGETLIRSGVVLDEGMFYFDVRPSARYRTLEFRVADVSLDVDGAVLLAGLIRALVATCAEAGRREAPYDRVRPELLRVATWRAARSGLTGDLVDLTRGHPVAAAELVTSMLEELRPALAAHGDEAEVERLLGSVRRRGTGAERQRAAYRRRQSLADVIELILAETAGSAGS